MAKSAKPTPNPSSKPAKPLVHEDLKDMSIRVNEFGQIIKDYKIEDIVDFLNKNVKDKKFGNDE